MPWLLFKKVSTTKMNRNRETKCASNIFSRKTLKPGDDNCSKDDDASVQLLKESVTTNDVIDADRTSIVIQSKESELLMFSFVGGLEIEKVTKD
jgi:hypothetical protein